MSTQLKPDLFRFLNDLKENNTREWFNAHKDRYENSVREPLLAFIDDFGEVLPTLSEYFVADSRKVGGSLFRIHRDVRFSKDKSPYKTQAGVHFRHQEATSAHAPGYYLHLEPRNVFAGVGIWHPEAPALRKIREAIRDRPGEWESAVKSPGFRQTFNLEGESLKRPPQGFDPDHPMIRDLKRKDFIGATSLPQSRVLKPNFLGDFADLCKRATPFMRFLTDALSLEF